MGKTSGAQGSYSSSSEAELAGSTELETPQRRQSARRDPCFGQTQSSSGGWDAAGAGDLRDIAAEGFPLSIREAVDEPFGSGKSAGSGTGEPLYDALVRGVVFSRTEA